ncbi:purine-nucleoside phosphorylase [Picrophilus oshimae]|nr:purine-nucleoside phosphorylase [Picrophilus oshimae]
MAIITAKSVSENVIIVGNLERQRTVNSFLGNLEKVSEFAGYTSYQGEYNNKKVTTVFHGIGIPSISLITDDLISLGARRIIRFGSCNAIKEEIEPGSVVIPQGYSYNFGGTFRQYLNDEYSYSLIPDYDLMLNTVNELESLGIKTFKGRVFTSDALFTHSREFIEKMAKDNHMALELEGAGLYLIAGLKNVKALSVHLAYGNLLNNKKMDASEISEKEKLIAKGILNVLTR